MTGASSPDLVAASRWLRHRVVTQLFAAPGTGADATPLSRTGWLGGPLVALVVAATVLWGDVALAWARSMF